MALMEPGAWLGFWFPGYVIKTAMNSKKNHNYLLNFLLLVTEIKTAECRK
jgi:hypothetical protein